MDEQPKQLEDSRRLDQFVHHVHRRLRARTAVRSIALGALIAAAGGAALAAGFVLCGHAVARVWLIAPAAAGTIAAASFWLLGRPGRASSIRQADQFFQLEQGLSSAEQFRQAGRQGGLYDLQLGQTAGRVGSLDADSLPAQRPTLAGAAVLVLLAGVVWLCTFADSPAVVAEREQRQLVLEITGQVRDELASRLEQIEKELTADEKELFQKSKLREMVEKLEPTADRKEALRELARIQKQLRDRLENKGLKKDEKFADQLARELLKSQKHRELAELLKKQDFKDAADKLRDMKKDKVPDKDAVEQARDALDRVAEMKNRIEQAARDGDQDAGQLQDAAEQVANVGQALQQQLEKADAEIGECGQCQAGTLEELDEAGEELDEQLARAARRLDEMDAERKFAARLEQMQDCLGRCQSAVARSQCLVQAHGKKAGVGVDRSVNENPDQNKSGLDTRLTGQKNSGPSKVAIEAASSGTGVSRLTLQGRGGAADKQVESFLRREDVPQSIRGGVKRYFETIHDQPDESRP